MSNLIDYTHHTNLDNTLFRVTTNLNYCLINYNKTDLTQQNLSTLGLYRSVIMDNTKGMLVCISPPKSVSPEWFMTSYNPTDESVYAQEFVEGTMINVFWDMYTNRWMVNTKKKIGAICTFYSDITFETMFMDACIFCNLHLENLDKSLCYSFVLQHPNNRIVVKVRHPCLYLIQAYKIHPNNQVEYIEVPADNYMLRQHGLGFEHSNVQVPNRYIFTSYVELQDRFTTESVTPYNILGVVIRCKHIHCKIRNPTYLKVRDLRGIFSKLDYNYLRLRKLGKVADFLLYFPEYKQDISDIRKTLYTFTNQLYSNYVSCYIYKQNNLGYFNDVYQRHMKKIHYIYLTTLKNVNKSINKYIVIEYVNSLDISLQNQAINSITKV